MKVNLRNPNPDSQTWWWQLDGLGMLFSQFKRELNQRKLHHGKRRLHQDQQSAEKLALGQLWMLHINSGEYSLLT